MIKINFNQLSMFCENRGIGLIGAIDENIDFRGLSRLPLRRLAILVFADLTAKKVWS